MTLQEALDLLPNDPLLIARFLQEKRITGQRFKASVCPLANYISRMTGRPTSVINGEARVYWQEHYRAPLSPSQEKFVQRFDRGEFNFLLPKLPGTITLED